MATTNKMIKPGREGYKILFDTNTVIMNYKFAAAAAKYGTKENRIIRNIRHDFPGMTEIVVAGRVQTTAKANHRLTYESISGSMIMLTSCWKCSRRSRQHPPQLQAPTSML